MSVPEKSTHRNTFDFLRLLAATVVVVAHAVDMLDAQDSILKEPAGLFDGLGIFFIISGFLVYKSARGTYERTGDFRQFALNRWLRVAPALYAYTIVVAILLVAIGAVALHQMASLSVAKWVLGTLVMVPLVDPPAFSGFGTGQINPALYTITAEVTFYVAVPFLYLAAKRWGLGRIMLLCLPVAIIAPVLTHATSGAAEHLLHDTFLNLFAFFLAGIFWTKYWDRAPKQWWVFAGSFALYLLLKKATPDAAYDRLAPALVALPLSYCVIWFAYKGPLALATFTHRFGDISYGTYLWHLPIINFFVWKGWGGAWTVPVVLVVTWTLAQLSWRLIERRALLLKRISERKIETGEKVA